MSISITTRSIRVGEIDGKDYHFVDDETFLSMKNKGELLEYAQVFGNFYGTPRGPVEADLSCGKDVIFDIDWQGANQLKTHDLMLSGLVSIFIFPPNSNSLEKRLLNRGQNTSEEIGSRMARAQDEMSHYEEYDYLIINHDIEESVHLIKQILHVERLKTKRQIGLDKFLISFGG